MEKAPTVKLLRKLVDTKHVFLMYHNWTERCLGITHNLLGLENATHHRSRTLQLMRIPADMSNYQDFLACLVSDQRIVVWH